MLQNEDGIPIVLYQVYSNSDDDNKDDEYRDEMHVFRKQS